MIKKKRTTAPRRSSLCKHSKVPNSFHCSGAQILHLYDQPGEALDSEENFFNSRVKESSLPHLSRTQHLYGNYFKGFTVYAAP